MSNPNNNVQYVWVSQGDDMNVETGSYHDLEGYVDSVADGQEQVQGYSQETLKYVESSQKGLNGRKHRRSRQPRRHAEARKAQATQALAYFDAMYNSQQGGSNSQQGGSSSRSRK